MPMNVGDFKQQILKVYNAVNKAIFSVGVRQQNVEFVANKIVILSVNSRVPILKLLDEDYAKPAEYFNFILSQTFKRHLQRALEEAFQLHIVAVFKDYDVKTEYSGTIIVLDRDVEEYLSELSELP